MATRLANLNTALDNMAQQLADITANPKTTYNVDGQMFDWLGYQKFLVDQMAALRAQINSEDDALYTEETQIYTSTPYGAHRAQNPWGRGPGAS